jgi:exopolysaccharide production protein ExoQ
MAPALALAVTFAFCAAVLRYDSRSQRISAALTLPIVWIFFVASRFPSQWLYTFGMPGFGRGTIEEGNPLDAAFFLLLIVAGMVVLQRRRVRVLEFAAHNVWLTLFFAYCFLAILWSDFPFVAFKRWIKVLGHPVMALIILTEPEPLNAMRIVMKRAAFIMLPLSVTFIKYFPEIGRAFDQWSGAPTNSGIHHNKNELGYTCMVFALFFFWNFLSSRRMVDQIERHRERAVTLLFAAILAWLFMMADSATSAICAMTGMSVMLLLSTRLISRQYMGAQVVVIIAIVVGVGTVFDVYGGVLRLAGRGVTLTDRTELWQDVLAIPLNPVVGAGFESFWLGDRLQALWAKWWWRPNQAHNGYLNTYLNLGWVGVFLLICCVLSAFHKGRAALTRNFGEGQFRLAFLLVILLYNYTESAFTGVHVVWTMFHLIAIDYPRQRAASTARAPQAVVSRSSPLLSHAAFSRPRLHRENIVSASRMARGGHGVARQRSQSGHVRNR